jgi:hypothetical protein
MGMFFTEGGVVMYPTLVFGFALVASAAMSIAQPEKRWLTFVCGVLTFASGLLGTTLGVINTMKYVAHAAPEEHVASGTTGIAESMNNLVLSMILIIIALLISGVAAFKHSTSVAPRA